MATLVLGTIGRVFGGPIGQIVGTLAGRSIDAELFRPKGGEGPRLTELAMQTSSYGSTIPLLFGAMRIAGSVIWSTDLIETSTTSRHGKGQPSSTTYSYSASFAVLLSGRAIGGVGRIWADGNLLRGAAGDFKTATGFRLHSGDADQSPDPLIASIEGAATPAYRGSAYAVFENLQLGDFGNRIPSLTFEVFADPGAVTIGTIAERLGGGAIVDGDATATLDGFAADGPARDAIGLLLGAGGAWLVPDGARLRLSDAAIPAVTIGDDGFAADERGGARQRCTIAAIESVPRTVSVAHYDAARDYQIGMQRAARPGPGAGERQVALPAVIAAGTAKALATRLLLEAESDRERRTVTLSADAAAIAPGTIATIAGEEGTWRVIEAGLENMVTTLVLARQSPGAPAPIAATPGRVLPAPDVIAGATLLVAAELPPLDDALPNAPRLSVIAAGTASGWRGAALLYSLDGGIGWRDGGATAAPGVLGTVTLAPGAAPATLFDLANTIEVALARDDMTLSDADAAALDHGANLALVGDELVQFGLAAPIGRGRWRLSRLWRGRRGSEAAIAGHVAGERFALLIPGTIATIDLPVAALGSTVTVMASGIGDGTDPPAVACVTTGGSVAPPGPVRLAVAGDTLRWIRRSRAGFRWIDGGDVPLAEEAERYRVEVTRPGLPPRLAVTEAPELALLPEETASGTAIAVRQLGTVGESPPTVLTIP